MLTDVFEIKAFPTYVFVQVGTVEVRWAGNTRVPFGRGSRRDGRRHPSLLGFPFARVYRSSKFTVALLSLESLDTFVTTCPIWKVRDRKLGVNGDTENSKLRSLVSREGEGLEPRDGRKGMFLPPA